MWTYRGMWLVVCWVIQAQWRSYWVGYWLSYWLALTRVEEEREMYWLIDPKLAPAFQPTQSVGISPLESCCQHGLCFSSVHQALNIVVMVMLLHHIVIGIVATDRLFPINMLNRLPYTMVSTAGFVLDTVMMLKCSVLVIMITVCTDRSKSLRLNWKSIYIYIFFSFSTSNWNVEKLKKLNVYKIYKRFNTERSALFLSY